MRTYVAFELLAIATLGGATSAQTGMLDQSSPIDGGLNFTTAQTHYQQQVRAGMDGTLEGIDLYISGVQTVQIRVGDAWNMSPPLWTGSVLGTDATQPMFIDVSAAGIPLLAGDTFVIELVQDFSGGVAGANSQGDAGYPETLCMYNIALSGPFCSPGGLFPEVRIGFRTWMLPDASDCGTDSANSVGAGATLAGQSGAFVAVGLPPGQPGIGYYGPSSNMVPFGCGTRCVGGAVTRLAVVVSNGSGIAVFTDSVSSGQWLQFWYRDPANFGNCGATFNLSNVLQVP